MKTKTYNKFKSLLTKACDKQVKAGGKIACGAFKVGENYCPIGLAAPVEAGKSFFLAMDRKLGDAIPEQDYWDFIDGFDNNTPNPRQASSLLFKLGRKLHKLYTANITRR